MCSTADIRHCICLANAAFNTFTKLWMQPRKISITLLMHVYNAMVLSVFMYNSSSWAAPKNVLEKLDTCHCRHLRRILRCRRPSAMSNSFLYIRCGARPLSELVRKGRWRMLGHVLRLGQTKCTN